MITKDSCVNVKGWTKADIHKAAKIFQMELGGEIGDLDVMGHHYVWLRHSTFYDGDMKIWVASEPTKEILTQEDVLGKTMKTPCEMLGYEVGDKFIVNDNYNIPYGGFNRGDVVTLYKDDEDDVPQFKHSINDVNEEPGYIWIEAVDKIGKLADDVEYIQKLTKDHDVEIIFQPDGSIHIIGSMLRGFQVMDIGKDVSKIEEHLVAWKRIKDSIIEDW